MRKKPIRKDEVKRVKVRSLVDTGAYMRTINDDVKNQPDLPVIERQFVTPADETQLEVEVVGPVEVRFENRRATCCAVVLPTAPDVPLGSILMDDLDVLVHPDVQKNWSSIPNIRMSRTSI